MSRRGGRGTPSRRLAATHRDPDGRGRAPKPRPRPRSAPIEVVWDGVRRRLPDGDVRAAARAARHHGGRTDLALSIVFTSDRALARMHARHLGDPSRTDVITFDLSDDVTGAQGELYVSADCAVRTARARRMPVRRELSLYVVHGVLHLCGLDDHDPDERAAMRQAETRVLRRLGFADDPRPHDA